MGWFTSPHAAGPDAAGYMNSAKLLTEGKLAAEFRVPAGAEGFSKNFFLPLGLIADGTGTRLVPFYPIGQPLQLAAFGTVFGWEAGVNVMNVIAMLGALVLLRAVAIELGVRPRWALGMAVLYALSPLVFSYSLQVMSELTSTLWILAAVYGALRSRGAATWALLAGFAMGMAVLVRPANVIAFLPVLAALHWRVLPVALMGAGGLPCALLLGWYNAQLYGSPFRTGDGNIETGFSVGYLPASLWQYAVWLPVVLTPLVIAGLALPWVRAVETKARWVLLVWAGVFLAFYACYYHTADSWWTLRFLVPALPAMAIAVTLVLQHVDRPLVTLAVAGAKPSRAPQAWRQVTVSVVAVLLPLAAAWGIGWSRHFRLTEHEPMDRVFRTMSMWVDKNVPADALFACTVLSGGFYYYTDRAFFTFDEFDEASYAAFLRLAEERGVAVYAGLMDHEEARAFAKMPGKWERVAQIRYGAVWRRVGP